MGIEKKSINGVVLLVIEDVQEEAMNKKKNVCLKQILA